MTQHAREQGREAACGHHLVAVFDITAVPVQADGDAPADLRLQLARAVGGALVNE